LELVTLAGVGVVADGAPLEIVPTSIRVRAHTGGSFAAAKRTANLDSLRAIRPAHALLESVLIGAPIVAGPATAPVTFAVQSIETADGDCFAVPRLDFLREGVASHVYGCPIIEVEASASVRGHRSIHIFPIVYVALGGRVVAGDIFAASAAGITILGETAMLRLVGERVFAAAETARVASVSDAIMVAVRLVSVAYLEAVVPKVVREVAIIVRRCLHNKLFDCVYGDLAFGLVGPPPVDRESPEPRSLFDRCRREITEPEITDLLVARGFRETGLLGLAVEKDNDSRKATHVAGLRVIVHSFPERGLLRSHGRAQAGDQIRIAGVTDAVLVGVFLLGIGNEGAVVL
jgi:hypothetical protein